MYFSSHLYLIIPILIIVLNNYYVHICKILLHLKISSVFEKCINKWQNGALIAKYKYSLLMDPLMNKENFIFLTFKRMPICKTR